MALIDGDDIVESDYAGFIWATVRRSVPSGWYLCNGQAVSRASNPNLYAELCPSATVTMTIASPGVITWTGHTLNDGDIIILTTTGALPTGFTAGTKYYVVNSATDTFQLSATIGGTAINTSGSQSGVHTAQCFTYGDGDGSTTFNVPDFRGRALISSGTGTKVATFVSRASNVITVSGLANAANNEFQTGQAVLYSAPSGAMTGLTHNTTYYIVRISNTTFSLATSLANAQSGTVIALSSDGTGAQTFTITLTARKVGESGGEEGHAISSTEMLAHTHALQAVSVGYNGSSQRPTASSGSATHGPDTASFGGNAAMNVMSPYGVINYLIHR